MISEEYETYVRQTLSPARAYHSVCVAEEAVRLAAHYGADEKKAETAGILHDITKETCVQEQLQILKESGIINRKIDLVAPKLLHAQTAALLIQRQFGITDPEIICAVRYHTTGRAHMALLEKILFLADFISADRDYPGVEKIRAEAYLHPEQAMLIGTQFTIRELTERFCPVHPDTVALYNEILCKQEKICENH